MSKILVVGGGGREHAIIRKLKENPEVEKIYALPGNGGIASDAECAQIGAKDIDAIVKFAIDKNVDFAVVAPDDPLVMGAVDRLNEAGIKCFGPDAKAARIEGSKVFSKQLMKKYNIPTAKYEVFENKSDALRYLSGCEYPAVIKADGLALGKGVTIAANYDEACGAVEAVMEEKIFGDSGNRIVIEEFLTGPEVSVLSFTDGNTIIPMISSMDHKRAHDGDKGPNTGGMGTIAPNPYYTDEIAERCMNEIFIPTIEAMKKEGCPFKGCLYFGLMLTPKGPKVIEYNCRFGDPETQVVLPLLKTDLLTIMQAVEAGKLGEIDIEFSSESACCVIAASGGYPTEYKTGFPIQFGDSAKKAEVYHAGTKLSDKGIVTSGGRVLGITAVDNTLEKAISKAYEAVKEIKFENIFFRADIGKRALEAYSGTKSEGTGAVTMPKASL